MGVRVEHDGRLLPEASDNGCGECVDLDRMLAIGVGGVRREK